ncbi:unnamed protein product [Parnassius apollo]|uniref:(apollo) hypothetical protein n=1 Tax=Parnassius apollo TaxID=110799 RepID=A0A8S3YFP5_PARAO|nr:unnamed protein product [Parnassius apollo]
MRTLRYYSTIRNFNNILGLSNQNVGLVMTGAGHYKNYSKNKDTCCKDISQTEGRTVANWPKGDSKMQTCRCNGPQQPQPPNYDPYKIRTPEVVVPPLPPSNAKWTGFVFVTPGQQQGYPPNQRTSEQPNLEEQGSEKEEKPKGFLEMLKNMFGRRKKEKSDSDVSMIGRPRRVTKRPFHYKDLPPCVQYLIIGAGAAAWAAYRSIIEHDKKAKVFFISKEDCLPYDRPPMSKHMWWNPDPPDIEKLNYIQDWKKKTMYLSEYNKFMDPVKFYRTKSGPAVSIATGYCVQRVDADYHVAWVKTQCGEQPIYYERCLLAPGSKPKQLSMFKSAPKPVRDRVCTLRTIRDLEIAYRSVKAAKHVAIIGGGPLGCELAWHLGRMNKMDLDVDPEKQPLEIVHIYKDKGIMAGVLPEYLGEWAAEKIKNEGVTVKPKTQVYDAFQSADGRLKLTLSDGSSVVTDYVRDLT